jgi:hypothetical protein
MRAKVVWIVLLVATLCTLVVDHVRLRTELKTLLAQHPPLSAASQTEKTPTQPPQPSLEGRRTVIDQPPPQDQPVTKPTSRDRLQPGFDRIVTLERQVQALARAAASASPSRSVPEYDPRSPVLTHDSAPPAAISEKRGWGSEQVAGPPDTATAGDHPTAWASRQPDAGLEWLWLDYEMPIDIAEVRVRESLNPGAITKIVAMANGQEVILWQGTAATGQAPRDFVIRPESNVSAQSIVVHLDTTRVAGWNEIDAVELVGRDGSRQWASGANSSSTYAER